MRMILAACLVCVLPLARGEIYKWVDADGVVQFSDQPVPGAEQVHIKPAQSYPAPALPHSAAPRVEISPGESAPAVVPYTSMSIVKPAADEAVRANDGNVAVSVALDPPLQAGHSVALDINGQRIASRANTHFVLENMPRGTHTLQAVVIDARGKQLIQAAPVTFHVLRTSLQAQPKPASGG